MFFLYLFIRGVFYAIAGLCLLGLLVVYAWAFAVLGVITLALWATGLAFERRDARRVLETTPGISPAFPIYGQSRISSPQEQR